MNPRRRFSTRSLCLGLAAATATALFAPPAPAAAQPVPDGPDDATVIAIIDGSFQPQHLDFYAAHMPQALNEDPSDDLPLDTSPDRWLPGFPSPDAFDRYGRLALTLPSDPARTVSSVQSVDKLKWDSVQQSSSASTSLYWVPNSKVIGMLDFAGNGIRGSNGSHGANTSSVAAGNLHGTCPECLVVLITYGTPTEGETAIEWAMSQPWIDVISNSYGFSKVNRDRLYSGSNTALQKTASERGQTIFFSAGNGQSNDFVVPNTTYYSSQEGPDWIVTVGATDPSGHNYSGAGKPADIAATGSQYPSIGGTTVSGSDRTFGGTSNATPLTAGLYARALYRARRDLDGPRVQTDGIIASGTPVPCGEVRPACELGDGRLTAAELRTRLFHGALRTAEGLSIGYDPTPVKTEESELAAEGHGTYFGRLNGADPWATEEQKIIGPMRGTAAAPERDPGERDWMIVDSYCRQAIWGSWSGGYYVAGATPLPGPSPLYPLRSMLALTCEQTFPPFRSKEAP